MRLEHSLIFKQIVGFHYFSFKDLNTVQGYMCLRLKDHFRANRLAIAGWTIVIVQLVQTELHWTFNLEDSGSTPIILFSLL